MQAIPPTSILFIILCLGGLLGCIRVGRFSLGTAGILFVAIAMGFAITGSPCGESVTYISELGRTAKAFSTLGSAIFVSIIGLATGRAIIGRAQGGLACFLVGSIMSGMAIAVMKVIAACDVSVSRSALWGALCGALTSTPGLSAVCEQVGIAGAEAVWGYSGAYLPGVILTVVSAGRLCNKRGHPPSRSSDHSREKQGTLAEIISIFGASAVGSYLGSLSLPLLGSSLGSTCGILCAAILGGMAVERLAGGLSSATLNALRNGGLALFLAGTGLNAGMQADGFSWRVILYGILITATALLTGYLLCKVILSRAALHTGCVIAGGMTSSPALGAILQQEGGVPIHQFSFAYLGALLSLVIAIPMIG